MEHKLYNKEVAMTSETLETMQLQLLEKKKEVATLRNIFLTSPLCDSSDTYRHCALLLKATDASNAYHSAKAEYMQLSSQLHALKRGAERPGLSPQTLCVDATSTSQPTLECNINYDTADNPTTFKADQPSVPFALHSSNIRNSASRPITHSPTTDLSRCLWELIWPKGNREEESGKENDCALKEPAYLRAPNGISSHWPSSLNEKKLC
ncbi:hypothetical protein CEUSTIGMA_g3282.t1 [Chlamydomonas eustigma]|uniref:Uncharacterized protein n=1 Tax=Chlamydomonas eustigma TaxID=1157962 RepID=A0A250WYR7_9CHLO|nr:hypothetical protein CEUSTIGMA_g3282.t1 [Chlamydomonas eustigma]|eukprot:GAX75839.1 hypothetical protein CEUSTIGMA_g3282.t1 [Chlamydomonas eustigma]